MGWLKKTFAQTTTTNPFRLLAKNNGVSIELRPSNGLVVDPVAGTIRTSQHGGLRGTPGYVWIVNTRGDGQAAKIRGGSVVYEGTTPILNIDPPVNLAVAANLICLPNETGTQWTIPYVSGRITAVVVYRNGLRQNGTEHNQTTSPYAAADYRLETTLDTTPPQTRIIPNPAFPWTVVRQELLQPDLVIADVFYIP